MSVVVKGMKMPNSCFSCEGCDGDKQYGYYCALTQDAKDLEEINPSTQKPDWCPLVELPEHHGDLIDRRDVLDSCEFIGEPPSLENPYSESYACKSEVIESISAIIEEE